MLLRVAVEMVVNSNSVSGGGGEWMGPCYQGATMSLRIIKFSAAMHLSGVQPNIIGGAEHEVSAWQAAHPDQVIHVKTFITGAA